MTARYTILLVEDDSTSRRLLASLLVEMGYDVVSAAGGGEALQYLYARQTCDAVLSDLLMPGMSGVELAKLALDARPGLRFVFVSGHPEAIQIARDAGALALLKPITRERLAGVLEEALNYYSNATPKAATG